MPQPGKGLRELGEGAHLRSRGEHRGCRLEERSVVGVSHHAGEAEGRLRARCLRRLRDGVHDRIVARLDRRVGRQVEERVDLRVERPARPRRTRRLRRTCRPVTVPAPRRYSKFRPGLTSKRNDMTAKLHSERDANGTRRAESPPHFPLQACAKAGPLRNHAFENVVLEHAASVHETNVSPRLARAPTSPARPCPRSPPTGFS